MGGPHRGPREQVFVHGVDTSPLLACVGDSFAAYFFTGPALVFPFTMR
jgi:hypothetical protein